MAHKGKGKYQPSFCFCTISAYQNILAGGATAASSNANASFYYRGLGLRDYEHGWSSSTGNHTAARQRPLYYLFNGAVNHWPANWKDDGRGAYYQRPALYTFDNHNTDYDSI